MSNKMRLNNKSLWAVGLAATIAALSMNVGTADARPFTQSYECGALQDYVKRRGAVVMNTKNKFVYRRLVASQRYCERLEVVNWTRVPAKGGSCSILQCQPFDKNAGRFSGF